MHKHKLDGIRPHCLVNLSLQKPFLSAWKAATEIQKKHLARMTWTLGALSVERESQNSCSFPRAFPSNPMDIFQNTTLLVNAINYHHYGEKNPILFLFKIGIIQPPRNVISIVKTSPSVHLFKNDYCVCMCVWVQVHERHSMDVRVRAQPCRVNALSPSFCKFQSFNSGR